MPAIGLFAAAPGFWLAGHFLGLMSYTLVSLCVWGAAVGFLGANVMPVLCQVSDRRYRATAYGLVNSSGAIAGGLAVYGAGAMRDLHIDWTRTLTLAGICSALCAVSFLLIRTDQAQTA